MDEFRPQSFGYAHSKAVMEGLKAYARLRKSIITESYVYIEKEGETEAFNEMIEVAKQCGRDILYVDSVKEFAGKSLADFKEALTTIEDAGMKVVSVTEKDYDYNTFMTAIEVLEDITPAYQKSALCITAITMHAMGADIKKICNDLGLSEADVYGAIAEYKRATEDK